MPPEVRAKDVYVAKVFQARCMIGGCGWASELMASYQEANTDRLFHLEDHRNGVAGTPGASAGGGDG